MVSSTGTVPFSAPNAGKDCFTWYKIFGKLSDGAVPVIALHGGPGAGHEYLSSLEDLTAQGQIPVVLYDQIGCGKSTALPEKKGDDSFWTVELFEQELNNLVSQLGIIRFDLFGHSWGGMLAGMYASKRPEKLRKLVNMGAPASVDLLSKGTAELRTQLSQSAQDTITYHEDRLEFEPQAYKDACLEFYNKFLCRCDPWPQELITSLGHLENDPTVYGTMFGPSELTCTGNLKNWSAIPHLHKIQNSTLLINGEYDEIVEYASSPYFEEIPKVKWIFLPNSSYTGMWEERERLMRVLLTFLRGQA